jgi:predicted AlkP superfamily phosphohydrolase/phosphomutase
VGELLHFYESQKVRVIILSEYGLTPAKQVIYPNRALRQKGWLSIKNELGLEYLDCGGSPAFCLTDHQIAHVYFNRQDAIRFQSPQRNGKPRRSGKSNLGGKERASMGSIMNGRAILYCSRGRMPGLPITIGWTTPSPPTLPVV